MRNETPTHQTPAPPAPEELVTASYTIPTSYKSRIDSIASDSDLNSSQVVRRILREHFARLDGQLVLPMSQIAAPIAA